MLKASKPTSNAPFQFVLPTIAALSATALVVAGLLAWSTFKADSVSMARQESMVSLLMKQNADRIPHDQEGVTIWDEAVVRVHADPLDLKWLDANLGVWMFSYFQHDRVYVLDQSDRAIYAMVDGKQADPATYAAVAGDIAPLARDLRRDMLTANPPKADSFHTPGAADVLVFDGRPAMVSVKPIVSDSGKVPQTPGSEFLHVSVRYLDGNFVTKLGHDFLLDDAHFDAEYDADAGNLHYRLASKSGATVGYFDWAPYLPGSQVLSSTVPALAAALVAIGVIFFLLLARIRKGAIALQESEAEAQHLAFHDMLTGLPNRALFESRLDRLLAELPRKAQKIALLYLDLDRFKQVNDTLGHPAGDALIREVARRLKEEVRGTDIVARLGGDEFAVILTGIKAEADVLTLCSRLEAAIKVPCILLGTQAFASISIGVAMAPTHGEDRTDLSRKADIALYDAKLQGRGRTVMFRHEMEAAVQQRREVERDLREAMKTGDGLSLAYQPLFAAGDMTVSGVEALLRWMHPSAGPMSPAIFIPIAEETGLIESLGDWVLRKACADALAWPGITLSVNASAVQMRNPAFGPRVMAVLGLTGLDPRRLQLEITETALLENLSEVRPTVAMLRSAGIRIALDDFGTGYSSLSHLRQFEIDRVKIDRSFVNGVAKNTGSEAIIQAIVDLARGTGVEITAEGVETDEQMAHLIAIGCHELQGYLLGRPAPLATIDALLGVARRSDDEAEESVAA